MPAGQRWSQQELRLLLEAVAESRGKEQLVRFSSKPHERWWQVVCSVLKTNGYRRTVRQCRRKWSETKRHFQADHASQDNLPPECYQLVAKLLGRAVRTADPRRREQRSGKETSEDLDAAGPSGLQPARRYSVMLSVSTDEDNDEEERAADEHPSHEHCHPVMEEAEKAEETQSSYTQSHTAETSQNAVGERESSPADESIVSSTNEDAQSTPSKVSMLQLNTRVVEELAGLKQAIQDLRNVMSEERQPQNTVWREILQMMQPSQPPLAWNALGCLQSWMQPPQAFAAQPHWVVAPQAGVLPALWSSPPFGPQFPMLVAPPHMPTASAQMVPPTTLPHSQRQDPPSLTTQMGSSLPAMMGMYFPGPSSLHAHISSMEQLGPSSSYQPVPQPPVSKPSEGSIGCDSTPMWKST
ncbi:uncharacterized protein LOC115078920 isoform X1 [Rhinatrema bivittatum]|uniref:uncharacterized protein LOC115078920 isoform X1 n=1 Tax=Rhinatrema bivittatum TaxID=194408 RepID=UPI00112B2F6D|nr:uncharacterized protein LOC115078920 isoform X1 [Rhinatrema bivittatum]